MKKITIELSEEYLIKLKALSKATGCTYNNGAKEAIIGWIDNQDGNLCEDDELVFQKELKRLKAKS